MNRNLIRATIALVTSLGLLLILWLEAETHTLAAVEAEVSEARLNADFVAASLRTTILSSMRHLHGIAGIVSLDVPVVRQVEATHLATTAQLNALNTRLEEFANRLAVEVIWILDGQGLCIASSNAGREGSFVGTRYHDRKYYKEAARGARGFQYAVGRVSNLPGFFFSAPVMNDHGGIVGAAVVKVDLPSVSWLENAASLVLDANGVIILASDRNLELLAMDDSPVLTMNPHVVNSVYKKSLFKTLELQRTAFEGVIRDPSTGQPSVLGKAQINEYGLSVVAIRPLKSVGSFQKDRLTRFFSSAFLLACALTLLAFAASRTRRPYSA